MARDLDGDDRRRRVDGAGNRFRFGLVARNLTTPEFGDGRATIELDREVRIGGAWGSGGLEFRASIVSVDGDLMSRRRRPVIGATSPRVSRRGG
jgi:hypothetical protein